MNFYQKGLTRILERVKLIVGKEKFRNKIQNPTSTRGARRREAGQNQNLILFVINIIYIFLIF